MSSKSKVLAHICLWLMMMLFFFACSPKITALNPVANIMDTEDDRILGLFKDSKEKGAVFHGQWFYFPGMGWVSAETHYLKVILVDRSTGKEVLSDD